MMVLNLKMLNLLDATSDPMNDIVFDKFKDSENAPESESLIKTICKYAVKIDNIWRAMDEKPEDWFDPYIIKALMESEIYDPDMWLNTICANEKYLRFLREIVDYLITMDFSMSSSQIVGKYKEEE